MKLFAPMAKGDERWAYSLALNALERDLRVGLRLALDQRLLRPWGWRGCARPYYHAMEIRPRIQQLRALRAAREGSGV